MFDMETGLIPLPFIMVLSVSFIAVDIERLILIPNPVLDGFGGGLNCEFAVFQGCYPAIHF